MPLALLSATGPSGPGELRGTRRRRAGLRSPRHRQDLRAMCPGPPPSGSRPLRPLRTGLPPAVGPAGRQARTSTCPDNCATWTTSTSSSLDALGYLPQGNKESEVLYTLIAESNERRSPGITSNVVFSKWESTFAKSMATAVAIDRLVHHSLIQEFYIPSYRTDAAQQRGETTAAEEVNRKN